MIYMFYMIYSFGPVRLDIFEVRAVSGLIVVVFWVVMAFCAWGLVGLVGIFKIFLFSEQPITIPYSQRQIIYYRL